MAALSSRGPTREGRIKPDVVAPGTCILSTLSRAASMSSTFGTSTDPLFFYHSGTSMATPLVAGCPAVIRETLVKNGMATPSAALVKPADRRGGSTGRSIQFDRSRGVHRMATPAGAESISPGPSSCPGPLTMVGSATADR